MAQSVLNMSNNSVYQQWQWWRTDIDIAATKPRIARQLLVTRSND